MFGEGQQSLIWWQRGLWEFKTEKLKVVWDGMKDCYCLVDLYVEGLWISYKGYMGYNTYDVYAEQQVYM